MAGQNEPSVEWVATTAAAIYVAQFKHFMRTSGDGDVMESGRIMDEAVETAHLLWMAAAESAGPPSVIRARTA